MMNSTTTRESFPDVLRGAALLGIALVNVPFLAINTASGIGGADLTGTADAAIAFMVTTLLQAKFYLIFSFLFGYSAHFIIKGDRRNRRRWVMRAVGLVLLGAAHATLLFHGDILLTYGLIALLLLAFYFRKDKTIAMWMWVAYGASAFLMSALVALIVLVEQTEGPTALDDTAPIPNGLDIALASGTLVDTIAARIELLGYVTPQVLFIQGQMVLVGFLAGVLGARRTVFERTPANERRMRRVLLWGATIGLPFQALAAWIQITNSLSAEHSEGLGLISFAINTYAAPPLSAAIVAGLWLLTARSRTQRSLLASAGQMALTLYLGQSLITTVLYSNWGLGLFGTMGVLEVTLVATGIWCALALTARLILGRYSSGPMESLLKKFSLFGAKTK